jgi:hypothetical protein
LGGLLIASSGLCPRTDTFVIIPVKAPEVVWLRSCSGSASIFRNAAGERPKFGPLTASFSLEVRERLESAIDQTREWLLREHPEGHWVGELEGDTILESDHLASGVSRTGSFETALRQNYLVQAASHRGWAIYPGAARNRASVKAYFA